MLHIALIVFYHLEKLPEKGECDYFLVDEYNPSVTLRVPAPLRNKGAFQNA